MTRRCPAGPSRIRGTAGAAWVAAAALLLTSCASGSLATSDTSPVRPTPSVTRPSTTGPTLVVTVPELVPTGSAASAPAALPTTSTTDAGAADGGSAAEQPEPTEGVTPEPADGPEPTQATQPPAAPVTTAAAAAPAGDGLNVSLANCDGCTVLGTHRDVAGGRSAALVSTGSGRGILLSVAPDGQVAGVIGVPYGAAFTAPADGVLPCAQGRCVVQGRQADGRAVLSAFELTGTGAWRDVSGDDAFPSATERSAVIDLDGELAIAVQDQAGGPAVWMLYTWGGDRYAVLGCAPDGDPPTTAAAVSPATCLS